MRLEIGFELPSVNFKTKGKYKNALKYLDFLKKYFNVF
jgi:hypothetical protein